jgi:hypothetical protein
LTRRRASSLIEADIVPACAQRAQRIAHVVGSSIASIPGMSRVVCMLHCGLIAYRASHFGAYFTANLVTAYPGGTSG